jgi:hypothetical protein
MNTWVGFCLYVAGGVFIQDQKSDERHPQSITNLEFLVAAMKAIGNRHSITKHFTAQLELDMEGAGIKPSSKPSESFGMPNTPLNGILPSRSGAPMTVADLRSFGESSTYTDSQGKYPVKEVCTYIASMAKGSRGSNEIPLHGVIPRRSPENPKVSHPPYGIFPHRAPGSPKVNHPPEGIHEHIHPSLPNWNPPSNTALDGSSNPKQPNQQQQQNTSFQTSGFALTNPPVPADPNAPTGGSPFNIDSFLAGNTPSSDSSSSNTMQFPYRQADPNNQNKSPHDYTITQPDSNDFLIATADWMTNQPFNTDLQDDTYSFPSDRQPSDEARQFIDTESWGRNPGPPHG